jgi:hypothetical protein
MYVRVLVGLIEDDHGKGVEVNAIWGFTACRLEVATQSMTETYTTKKHAAE